jgi:hypothetical protein
MAIHQRNISSEPQMVIFWAYTVYLASATKDVFLLELTSENP